MNQIYQPQTNQELYDAVYEWCLTKDKALKKYKCHISNWDTSKITDMSELFYYEPNDDKSMLISNFNDNISKWDTSNVTNMASMFNLTSFNGDISKWNVSKVKNMCCMFEESVFN